MLLVDMAILRSDGNAEYILNFGKLIWNQRMAVSAYKDCPRQN
jgi:hypothetical protein